MNSIFLLPIDDFTYLRLTFNYLYFSVFLSMDGPKMPTITTDQVNWHLKDISTLWYSCSFLFLVIIISEISLMFHSVINKNWIWQHYEYWIHQSMQLILVSNKITFQVELIFEMISCIVISSNKCSNIFYRVDFICYEVIKHQMDHIYTINTNIII